MDIILDFDGTCVAHDFPNVGKEIGAVPVLKELVKAGHKLILFTMRSNLRNPHSNDPDIHCQGGDYLTQACIWFINNGIPLYGVQTNPAQKPWTTSPKAYGQIIIDDAALGCPLKTNPEISDRPFVDWQAVESMLISKQVLEPINIAV